MKEKMLQLFREEQGQAMTEYGLIIALIAVVVITALGIIGTNLNLKFTDIGNKLQ